jgi:hypothetical protein
MAKARDAIDYLGLPAVPTATETTLYNRNKIQKERIYMCAPKKTYSLISAKAGKLCD